MNAELFVEIRTEELPPSMIGPAVNGLAKGLVGLLAGIGHGAVRTWATPRRIAVAIDAVEVQKPTIERLVTGPGVDRAYDAAGNPTQAAIGFAKGKGRDASELRQVDTPKGKVIAVMVTEGGARTVDVVAAGLAGAIAAIPFHKSMRSGRGAMPFGRPIASIAALFEGAIVPGDCDGIPYGDVTEGHRLHPERQFAFASAGAWLAGLRERWVEPDVDARRGQIRAILDAIAADHRADRIDDPALIDQVTHLVEAPTPHVCEFEADLLNLPPRLLVESMRVHQRVFPIHVEGRLTNRFAVIGNNPMADRELVSLGNAYVLRARFHDAKFFFAEDKKKPLEAHGEGLTRMRWIKGLGTMADKVARVGRLAERLAPSLDAGFGASGSVDEAVVARAAALAKADLLTAMVNEFPELQGHMGGLYAIAQGEPTLVAAAIEEHWWPRFAGDRVAKMHAGVALALADRLDTLVGCFGVGMVPKGGGDPQGLRRAAIGLVNTLLAHRLDLDLDALFRTAVDVFHFSVAAAPGESQAWVKERGTGAAPKDADALVAQLVEFANARLKAQSVDDGVPADVVDAVIEADPAAGRRPCSVARRVAALEALRATADFVPLAQMFKRVVNISRPHADSRDRAESAVEPAERELLAAVTAATGRIDAAMVAGDEGAALRELLVLRDPIAAFFDAVLVDDPDPEVRGRRIGLLQRVASSVLRIADFSRITTR